MSTVVCNASPLIVLAKAKLLHVIPKIFERAFVPQAVLDEIAAGSSDDPIRGVSPKLLVVDSGADLPPTIPTLNLGN